MPLRGRGRATRGGWRGTGVLREDARSVGDAGLERNYAFWGMMQTLLIGGKLPDRLGYWANNLAPSVKFLLGRVATHVTHSL